MGRVLIETAAAGKARLGSNVGGIPTVIEDEVDGLLFESGNQPDLTRQMDRLMSNPALVRKLGERAKKRALEQFTDAVYLDQLEEFYSAIYKSAI